MSDDAGQFEILLHALYWIHVDRVFQRILPLNKRYDKELNWVHIQMLKSAIAEHFNELCQTKTSSETLNQALKPKLIS